MMGRCGGRRALGIARATCHLRSRSTVTGQGTDVLPVLLGKALQRGNPLAGFTPFRGREFDRLRQCLMPLGEFLQALVDRHRVKVGWDVGFEPTTSRTTIWRSTN